MTFRAVSTATVVLNGGNSSRLCQPSSNATRASASKRPLALDCAPRPRRRSRSIATANSGKGDSAPAGSEGAVTGGGLRAGEGGRRPGGGRQTQREKQKRKPARGCVAAG